jgi:FkbH-like protein
MICSSLCPFLGMLNLLVGLSRPSTACDTSSFLWYELWGLGHRIPRIRNSRYPRKSVTLREALVISNRPPASVAYGLHLCCGFEPLHLTTFLQAHLRLRLPGAVGDPSPRVVVSIGRFGDLAGNIERALSVSAVQPVAVVLEWADLDPRLGLREGFRQQSDDDDKILTEATTRLAYLQKQLTGIAGSRRIVLSLPATPLPPWGTSLGNQASALTLELHSLLATFAARCGRAGVRVAELPPGPAYDFRAHLQNGFPYVNSYADALASRLAALLLPPPPKKGLITDLDNTVWSGIVGDEGPHNVHWSLEQRARPHGVYQQFLAGMAAQGVLIAAASKNDPAPVAEALARTDLLFPASVLFPIETNWGPKSESLRRIAQTWNVGLDTVVFVDDNPLELAEVSQALPEVECHLFPSSDPAAILELLHALRLRFAREQITAEDRIRSASLRGAAEYAKADAADPEKLLAGLDARISFSFSRDAFDPRALELLNKTNQFNLNGRRWEESSLRAFLGQLGAVLCVASYEDRFGALGKIAVAVGIGEPGALRLQSWVLSCRAFSRRIEFATLEALFDQTGAGMLFLDWQSTARNSPTRETLAMLFDEVPEAGMLCLARDDFTLRCPRLYPAMHLLP